MWAKPVIPSRNFQEMLPLFVTVIKYSPFHQYAISNPHSTAESSNGDRRQKCGKSKKVKQKVLFCCERLQEKGL